MFSLFLPNTTKKLMVKEYKKGIKPQRDKLGRCHRRQGMPALIDEQDSSAGWRIPALEGSVWRGQASRRQSTAQSRLVG